MKRASLVIGPDKIRCIYEIQNSGQKYNVSYPFTKAYVNVFPVTNNDLKTALVKMDIVFDNKVTPKGMKIISNKLFFEMQELQGTDKEKLEQLNILNVESGITTPGLKLLSVKLAEEIASAAGVDLAIDECEKEGTLLKFVK
jgi:hypothetical protein